MANNKLDKFKALVSKDNSGWLEKTKWRQENQDWLDISFSIAVKMLSVLSANKKTGIFPKSQKELAIAMDCSPQYINKLLKGSEKLNIETISKIQKALKFPIINNGIISKKVEIVVKQEEVFIKPKVNTDRKYKKLDGVIHHNFTTSRKKSQLNEYKSVVNE